MIPLVARIRAQRGARSLRVWIPLFLVWIVLLPIALLLIPLFLIACIALRVRAWSALQRCWNVLNTLPGTCIDTTNGADSFGIVIH